MLDSWPYQQSRNLRLIVACLLIFGVGVATTVMLWALSWDAPLDPATPEPIFAIGPLAPGGSVEQEFKGVGSYLTGLEIFVRTDSEENAQAPFIMRLFEGDSLLRQNEVTTRVSTEISAVRWDFAPIVQIEDHQFRLQIVVGERTGVPVYIMASLTDMLPGAAVTNGIPTGDHIDVALRPWRTIQRADVFRAATTRLPAGLFGLVAAISALTLFVGHSSTKLIPPHGSRSTRLISPFVTGLVVTLFILAIKLRMVGLRVLPEQEAKFWPEWIAIVVLVGVALWGLDLSRRLGRYLARLWNLARFYNSMPIDQVRDSLGNSLGGAALVLWRPSLTGVLIVRDRYAATRRAFGGGPELLLAIAVFAAMALTLTALVAHILEGPDSKVVQIQVLKSGNPLEGNLDLLNRIHTALPPKLAGIAWLVVAIGTLLLRLTRRQPIQLS
jgi:hypothetical protein